MTKKRKQHNAIFKAKVALEAAKGLKTSSQLTSEYGISSGQISTWKKHLLDEMSGLFEKTNSKGKVVDEEALTAPLYQEIGRLKMDLDWQKKSVNLAVQDRCLMVDIHNRNINVSRQCELLGLARSSFYYKLMSQPASCIELKTMKMIDKIYTTSPFYGSRRITAELNRQGDEINRKRTQRYMRTMGIQGVAPGPNRSKSHPENKIYPYLLRGKTIDMANQVWSTDITYIPMPQGFMYLVAVIDWGTRYVLSWELSNTLDTDFCISALLNALKHGHPEIFNTDQGCQFTSLAYTKELLDRSIQISMDGRGRALDNIFVERLWRTVKYENIYMNSYGSVIELYEGLQRYFYFYNEQRLHQSLGYNTPASAYFSAVG